MEGDGRKGSRLRPTLKTIADLCGLGVPSVSRALNDSPEIGEETKRRVREIAQRVGYVPDRAGQLLRTGQTFMINLVFRISPDDQMSRLIPSIARALLSTRFQITITPALTHEDGLASIRQAVDGRLADAVIFNETQVDDPRTAFLLERGFPFATHGRSNLSHLHPYYDFDNGSFARQSAELLRRRGRHCLALLGPPHDRFYGLDTFLHAREAAAEHGLQFCQIEGTSSSDSLETLQAATLAFVTKHPTCDGFVCSSDTAALAVTSALNLSGKTIGREVEVIAKGSRRYLGMVHPRLVVIEEDSRRGAEFLARAVLQAIRSHEEPAMQEIELPDFSDFL